MNYLTKLTFVISLLFFPQALQANEKQPVLNGTIDFCLKLPSDHTTLDKELKSIGWNRRLGEDGDRLAAYVLYSSIFTIKHRSEDLDYTYMNSAFMAVSILGNSALRPNQPAYTNGEMRLGVFGIREGVGYCVFTGPRWATNEIEKKLGITLKKLLPYLKSYDGTIGAHDVRVQQIDIEKFHLVKSTIPKDKLEKYRAIEKEALKETNLYIGRQKSAVK